MGWMSFEKLNIDWNADPNAPEVEVNVSGQDIILEFYLNAYMYKQYNEGDKARLIFHNCIQYRLGEPNDEGFYVYGKSRYKGCGVEWGEFYLVHNSDWKKNFPDAIKIENSIYEKQNHYLFYFRDETFECIADSYDMEFLKI